MGCHMNLAESHVWNCTKTHQNKASRPAWLLQHCRFLELCIGQSSSRVMKIQIEHISILVNWKHIQGFLQSANNTHEIVRLLSFLCPRMFIYIILTCTRWIPRLYNVTRINSLLTEIKANILEWITTIPLRIPSDRTGRDYINTLHHK